MIPHLHNNMKFHRIHAYLQIKIYREGLKYFGHPSFLYLSLPIISWLGRSGLCSLLHTDTKKQSAITETLTCSKENVTLSSGQITWELNTNWLTIIYFNGDVYDRWKKKNKHSSFLLCMFAKSCCFQVLCFFMKHFGFQFNSSIFKRRNFFFLKHVRLFVLHIIFVL